MGYEITAVRDDGTQWVVDHFSDDDPERSHPYSFGFTRIAVANRMGAYGFTSQEAVLSLLHEFHWGMIKPEPRDDPALIAGWVTSTEPDAERAHLYTTPVGTDAAAAHRCRMDACAAAVDLRDPDGLLPVYEPDPELVREHREMTDTFRWANIYGDLPAPPRRPEETPDA